MFQRSRPLWKTLITAAMILSAAACQRAPASPQETPAGAVAIAQPIILKIAADGVITLNGETISRDELGKRLTGMTASGREIDGMIVKGEFVADLEKRLSKAAGGDKTIRMYVETADQMAYGELGGVMELLQKIPHVTLSVIGGT